LPATRKAELGRPRRSLTHVSPDEPLGAMRVKAVRPSAESPEKDHTVSVGPPGMNGRHADEYVAPPREDVPSGHATHVEDDEE
jgi:hypothetical protein